VKQELFEEIQVIARLPRDITVDGSKITCPRLMVYGADFANCNGEYVLSNSTVSWASLRPVYKHTVKNRVIFWNAGGLGWSIGKKAYLITGSHWHKSGLDSKEPWQGDWEKNVVVECAGSSGGSAIDCLWSGFSDWSSCSSSCGEGVQNRLRKVLQPARNEGLECGGEEREERKCKTEACPGKF